MSAPSLTQKGKPQTDATRVTSCHVGVVGVSLTEAMLTSPKFSLPYFLNEATARGQGGQLVAVYPRDTFCARSWAKLLTTLVHRSAEMKPPFCLRAESWSSPTSPAMRVAALGRYLVFNCQNSPLRVLVGRGLPIRKGPARRSVPLEMVLAPRQVGSTLTPEVFASYWRQALTIKPQPPDWSVLVFSNLGQLDFAGQQRLRQNFWTRAGVKLIQVALSAGLQRPLISTVYV